MSQTHQRTEVWLPFRASATQPLLLGVRPIPDSGPRLGEIVVELRERKAGVLLLVGSSERHAELQQVVGRLGGFWIILIALGESAGRFRVSSPRIIGLAQPIFRASGQRVFGMLGKKRFKRILCSRVVCLLEQTKRRVVLVRSGTGRRLTRRRRA